MNNILISSSVLIVVIAFLRLIFRNKVSHRLQYALWLLAALRLLIPFEFGTFQFSIHNLIRESELLKTPIAYVEETAREPLTGPSFQEVYEEVFLEYRVEGYEMETPQIQLQLEQETADRITAPTWGKLAHLIWIAGIAAMGIWFLAVNLRFRKKALKNSTTLELSESPIPVRVSDGIASPCLLGLIRPVVYLTPCCADNPQKRRHVLTHELTHFRHLDHIWSMVRCICLCIYWFNPLIWLAAVLSKRDCELACDEGALKILGDEERLSYGRTLLDMVSKDFSPRHLFETATAMNESKKQLTERVKFIVKKPKLYLITAICLTLTILLVTGCAFTGTADPPLSGATADSSIPQDDTTAPATDEPAPTVSYSNRGPYIYDFEALKDISTLDFLVTDGYSESYDVTSIYGTKYTFTGTLPHVYPVGSARTITIRTELIYDEYFEEVKAASESGTPCRIHEISYDAYLNNDVLSIVTWVKTFDEGYKYEIFNINLTTGTQITKLEDYDGYDVLCGINQEYFDDVLLACVEEAFFQANKGEDISANSKAYQNQLQQSIDKELRRCLDHSQLPSYIYFDLNGHPIFCAEVFSLDGKTIKQILVPFEHPYSPLD